MPLRRGRWPHHAWKAIIGTWEARPGPLDWSPVGDSGKALPEPRSELRSGVGLVHSTCEVVEGNETHGGKGPARGEPAREGQGPDAEPGCLAAEPRTGEHGSQAGCPNPVHGLAAPRRRGRSASGVSTTKAAGQRGGRRDNGGEVRREAHG